MNENKDIKSVLAVSDKDVDKSEGKTQLELNASLTEWANAPKLADLQQDLLDAKSYTETHKSHVATWLDNRNISGKAKIKTPKNSSSVQPKLIRKQAEWRYSALSEPFLSTKDIYKISPKTWEDTKAAKHNELILNHQFNTRIDKVKFIDEFVRTAVDEGTAIIRVGWDSVEEEIDTEVLDLEFVLDDQLGPLHQHLAKLKEESPSEWLTSVPDELKQAHEFTLKNGYPVKPIIKGRKTVQVIKVIKNQPTVEICDYKNVIIDPSCEGDIDRANFIGFTFTTSLSALKKDGRYSNLDHINVEGSSVLSTPDHTSTGDADSSFNLTDEPRKKLVAQEYIGYWDIDGNDVVKPIVATWVGETLIRLEETPFPDKKIPIVIAQYMPVRKSSFGEPDGALLEDNQKVLGAVMRGMIDVMGKSANGQTGIRKDMLDTTNRHKFNRGEDYEFNPGVDPRQGIYSHVFPDIPSSAEYMMQLQNTEAESLTGVTAFAQAGVSGSQFGDVAVGVRGALDAASKREMGILRRLSDAMIKIGEKIISMNSEFLSEEETVRITNEKFVTVRKEDLPGEFDLELTISTAEEDNNRAEKLAFMLQTNGPNGDPEVTKMIQVQLFNLYKMPALAHQIENYQPQPDPIAQEKAQLEVELLKAQIANEYSKAKENESQANLDNAKSVTEGGKQIDLQATVDKKALDFTEQESGVTQERELQLRAEQAKSQMDLKKLDIDHKDKEKRNDLLAKYLENKGQ